jgi:sugar/nucleoside kinase (ribokinase family)
MDFAVFGDSNVDVTVAWDDVEENLDRLSEENRRLLSAHMDRGGRYDIECYLDDFDRELSDFFNSLPHRTEFGGCGAIKSRTLASLGKKVTFFSWVGGDKNGSMILGRLSKSGVDTSHILIDGSTCETYNIFDPSKPRLAFSCWEQKQDFHGFKEFVRRAGPGKVLLTGAHRIKKGLGYSQIPSAFVFTGSLETYTKEELKQKYSSDFSKGIIMGNDREVSLLAGVADPMKAIRKLENEIIVMHGPEKTVTKVGGSLITAPTVDVPRERAKELTGLGDVWEAYFLASIDDFEDKEKILGAMGIANRASACRMLTGKIPAMEDLAGF